MEQDLSLEGPGVWSHEGERFWHFPLSAWILVSRSLPMYNDF